MDFNLSDAHFKRLAAFSKKVRIDNKISENKNKPPLISGDVLQTKDFTFSKFGGSAKEGDSGALLLAKQKADKNIRYVVKHAYTDSACNEFMYYNIAKALGISVPKVKLFNISEGEKRNYFITETIAGIEYINITQDIRRNFEKINKDEILNWQDYFSFEALFCILCEDDSFEIVIADNRKLYKIDNTAAFNLNNYLLDNLGFDFQYHDSIDIRKTLYEQLMKLADYSQYDNYMIRYNYIAGKYGKETAKNYLMVFEKFAQINLDVFDDSINTLCYFYADILGDFYKRFLELRKQECIKFIRT